MFTLNIIQGTTKGGCIIVKKDNKQIYVSKPLDEKALREFKNYINNFLFQYFDDYR